MPRYYFRTTPNGRQTDIEGEVLPNDNAACASAVASLSELLPVHSGEMVEGSTFGVAVAREDGTDFYRIEASAHRL